MGGEEPLDALLGVPDALLGALDALPHRKW